MFPACTHHRRPNRYNPFIDVQEIQFVYFSADFLRVRSINEYQYSVWSVIEARHA